MSDQTIEDYAYSAFVSYRHRPLDEKWALWVQEALETFETPQALVQEGIAQGIGKVFVDDTELPAASELTRAVKEALWGSRFLIVVASTDTPASDWVRQEIALFKTAWGRGDRVLVLLVEGTPATSFPPELRELRTTGTGLDAVTEMVEPAGASVVEVQNKTETELKALARDKLAAAILGCDLGQLRDRVIEREAQETTTRYFHDMVGQRGVPKGVWELDAAQTKRRGFSFRVEYRQGLVRSVRRINSRGFPTENEMGFCRWDISYRSDGSVEAIDCRNRNDDTKLREVYNRDATIVDFFHDNQQASAQPAFGQANVGVNAPTGIHTQKSSILRHLLTYDDRGYCIEKAYCSDAFNTPAQDSLGSYGERISRNDAGQITSVGYFDLERAAIVLRSGTASVRWEYDARGCHLSETAIGQNGAPILKPDGTSGRRLTLDDDGNVIEVVYVDDDGHPVIGTMGYARKVHTRDTHGEIVETWFYGLHDDRVPTKELKSAYGVRYAHNDQGYVIETVFLDAKGNPVTNSTGNAIERNVRDAKGNIYVDDYFGPDGQPTLIADGYAGLRAKIDDRGNLVEVACLGTDLEPSVSRRGYSTIRKEYDHRGLLVYEATFGADGVPAITVATGCVAARFDYDMRGNLIRQTFEDADGNPENGGEGYSVYEIRRDQAGRPVEIAYFTKSGKPFLTKFGYSRAIRHYDAKGNQIEAWSYGTDGALCIDNEGKAGLKMEYDGLGRITRVQHFGLDGKPSLGGNETSGYEQTHDNRGNVVSLTYFDRRGRPAATKFNYHQENRDYDFRGNIIERRFLDVDFNPVLTHQGIACARMEYDARGHVTRQVYLGVNGEPVLLDGQYAEFRGGFDERGNATDFTYLGVNGEPVARAEGYASATQVFDERNRLVSTSYFDENGHPAAAQGDAVRQDWTYDERGNAIEMHWFDAHGKPALNKDGYARLEASYNDRNQFTRVTYFDRDGVPVAHNSSGAIAFITEYDRRGHRITSISEDGYGNRVLSAKGYTIVRITWTPTGKRLSRTYHGLSGEPVNRTEGYHRVAFVRDRFGSCTETLYFDLDGKQIETPPDADEKADD